MPKQRLPEGHFEHADAASMIGVTKNTILRWEKLGFIDPPLRDRNKSPHLYRSTYTENQTIQGSGRVLSRSFPESQDFRLAGSTPH